MTEDEYKDEIRSARQLLNNYQALSASIESLTDTIRILELDAVSIKSAVSEQTPVQGGGNLREERLNANIVRRDELKRRLEKAELSVKIVNRALSTLNADERHILEVRYISRQRGGAERLRREFGYWDKSAVYKRENRALEHFALAVYAVMLNDPLLSLRQFFGDKMDN